jgi:hypothetical protein
MCKAITLYKPLTPSQLAAVISSGWRRFVPDHREQVYFYPKLHRDYAEQIARLWNARQYSAGYVAIFDVDSDFIGCYEIQTVAYEYQREYRIPVGDLERLNWHILGKIDVIAAYHLEPESDGLVSMPMEYGSFS